MGTLAGMIDLDADDLAGFIQVENDVPCNLASVCPRAVAKLEAGF